MTPKTASLVLAAGGSTTLSSQVLHLAPAPPKADILVAFDTTGSMGQAIADAKTDATSIVTSIQSTIPGARFAVADFQDYPFDPFGIGTEHVWKVDGNFSSSATTFQSTVNALTACLCGKDDPEAYNRAFYEAYHDSNLSWDQNAPRFMIVLGDSYGHDPAQANDFGSGFGQGEIPTPNCPATSPIDPGPDNTVGTADDLGTLPTLTTLAGKYHTNVSFVTYNPTSSPANKIACQTALAQFTGGSEVTHDAGTASLGTQIVNLITQAAAKVDQVTLSVTGTKPDNSTFDASSWLSTNPPTPFGPDQTPVDITYDETVTVPVGTPAGTYKLAVTPVADAGPRPNATQTITVDVRQQAVTALAMTADQGSTIPGIAQIPLTSIPADRLPVFAGAPTTASGGSLPGGSIPGGSIPGGSIPGGSIPGGSIPGGSITVGDIGLVGSVPGGSIPGGSIPGGSIPGGSIPGGSIGLQNALQSVLLSQIPLTVPADGATWPQVLAGTALDGRPLNTITLYDVSQNAQAWQNLARLPLRDVPFATSLWGSAPVASWLLGNATLDMLGPPPGFTSWSDALAAGGGSSAGVDTSHNTVFGVAIAGQLGQTDIGSIPGGSIPGGSIPGGSIPAGTIPARAIQLRSLNIVGSRLASVRLVDVRNAGDIVNCTSTGVDCTTKTLADAANAGAVLRGATYGDLLDRVPAGNPAKQMTISELIFAFLPQSMYPWEQLNIAGLQDVAGTGKNLAYHVDFNLDCTVTSTFALTATLPNGEFPVPGSSSVVYGLGGTQPVGDPSVSRSGATWSTLPAGVCPDRSSARHVRFNFSAYEGLSLGEHRAAVTVAANSVTNSASGQAPVTVTQAGEPNDDPSTAPTLQKDTLYVGHIAYSGDTDAFKFPLTGLPRGTKVKVFMKVPQSPPADLDLVLAKPNSPGVSSTPGGSIPGGSIPVENQQPGVDNSTTPLPPDTLSDVPQSTPGGSIPGGSIPGGSIPGGSIPGGSIPGGSISANRGTVSEAAQIVTNGEAGDAQITVSGYNGAYSTAPYVLRVQVTPPAPLPTCPAVAGLSGTGAPTPGVLPSVASVAAANPHAKTLFLVNRQRMAALYDGTNTTSVDTLLNTPTSTLNMTASRPEVNGVVLPIDGDANVRAKYQAWDASPCSIDAVNAVVTAINDVVNQYKAALPDVKYVVVLGNDTVIPFWRQYDRGAISPELDEAAELENFTDNLHPANAVFAAAAQNYVLTNGAYGVRSRISWLGADLPLPQDSVSRFVESTDDISGQLQQYDTTTGQLNPQSEFVSGDSFFSDSAAAADRALQAGFTGISASHLYPPDNPGWQKGDFLSAFFDHSPGVPDIGALYAHYNPWLAQPAGPTPFSSLSQLVSSADATAPAAGSLASKILFTIGCHSGLNIPDQYPLLSGSTASTQDWAETYAQGKAATYVANTGFGYDDTDSIAMSGRLMRLFAQKLNRGTGSIGEQWTNALNQYYSTAGDWDVLDEKVMLEATFYGPPWSHFASPAADTTPAAPTTSTVTNADGTSLTVASLPTINPTLHQNGDATHGEWFDIDGQTLSVPFRPIQPLYTRDVTVPGMHAHDAFITAMSVNDLPNVTPVRANPIVENPAYEPIPNYKNIFWPASPVTVLHSAFGDTLNFTAGQFRPNADPSTGTERQIVSLSAQVGYTTSSDDVRPLVEQVAAVMTDATTAHVLVRAVDNSGHIGKVAVLYNDGANNFKYQDLTPVPGSSDGYETTLTGLAASPEIIAEVRDDYGNVGMSANKASNYTALSVSVSDAATPAISIDSPVAGAAFTVGQVQRAKFECSSNAGVKTCDGTTPNGGAIDTSTPGAHTLTVTSTDYAGRRNTSTSTYYVRFAFVGFLAPVDNPPILNIAKVGSTVPVKWSLKDASGGYFRNLNAVTSISSSAIRCPNAATDPVTTDVQAGLAGLKYDKTAEQFVYNWQTLKTWAGTCRRLYVSFSDLSLPYADFQFK